MAEENNAAGNWASAMQQAQADLLRQWTEMSQAWAANAGSGAGPASGMGPSVGMGPGLSPGMPPGMDALARQFLQQSEQYMGVSRSLMDLLTRSAGAVQQNNRSRDHRTKTVTV